MKMRIIFWTLAIFLLFEMVHEIKADSSDGTRKVLLVSMGKYELSPLDYIEEDVSELGLLLQNRYDFSAEAFVDSAGTNSTEKDCHKKALMEKVEKWISRIGENDEMILYLAGHGVIGPDEKLYIAMINCDGTNLKDTAVPMEWFREQLEKASAKSKLIFVDACHSAETRGLDIFSKVRSVTLSKSFDGINGATTIASSRGDQESLIWDARRHSLFTYWLIQALKGNADHDLDGKITLAELDKYLDRKVNATAKKVYKRNQNPIILNPENNTDYSFEPKPVQIDTLLEDMAEQIGVTMELKGYKRVGVPRFAAGDQNEFAAKYGTLPQRLANDLEMLLTDIEPREYSIIARTELEKTLMERGIEVGKYGGSGTQDIEVTNEDSSEQLETLVGGVVKLDDEGCGATVSVSFINNKNGELVANIRGRAVLDADMFASMNVNAEMRQPDSVSLAPPPAAEEIMAEALRSDTDNIDDSQWPISFEVKKAGSAAYEPRKLVKNGNERILTIEKGEKYRIILENNLEEPLFARILVDGRNTVSQRVPTQTNGVLVDNAGEDPNNWPIVEAPCVPLEKARAWYLDPKEQGKEAKRFIIQGFYKVGSGGESTSRVFEIVDADKVLAEKGGFTDQIGMITAVFYDAAATRGDKNFMTGGTEVVNGGKLVLIDKKIKVGKMRICCNVRYMTSEALKEYMKTE